MKVKAVLFIAMMTFMASSYALAQEEKHLFSSPLAIGNNFD